MACEENGDVLSTYVRQRRKRKNRAVSSPRALTPGYSRRLFSLYLRSSPACASQRKSNSTCRGSIKKKGITTHLTPPSHDKASTFATVPAREYTISRHEVSNPKTSTTGLCNTISITFPNKSRRRSRCVRVTKTRWSSRVEQPPT